jgi:hypothetical protein
VRAGSVSYAASAAAPPAAAPYSEEGRETSKDSWRFSVCKLRKADMAKGKEAAGHKLLKSALCSDFI